MSSAPFWPGASLWGAQGEGRRERGVGRARGNEQGAQPAPHSPGGLCPAPPQASAPFSRSWRFPFSLFQTEAGAETSSFYSALLRIQPKIMHCWRPMRRTFKSYDQTGTGFVGVTDFRKVSPQDASEASEREAGATYQRRPTWEPLSQTPPHPQSQILPQRLLHAWGLPSRPTPEPAASGPMAGLPLASVATQGPGCLTGPTE